MRKYTPSISLANILGDAGCIKAMHAPEPDPIPMGKQSVSRCGIGIGDTVEFTPSATLKGMAVVTDIYKQHGYVYLVTGTSVHRLKDVRKAEGRKAAK